MKWRYCALLGTDITNSLNAFTPTLPRQPRYFRSPTSFWLYNLPVWTLLLFLISYTIMPTPAHSLPATWMQSLPTFLHSNELLCDLHLWLYKIQVLPVCMLDFNVPISFTEKEEEKEKEEEEKEEKESYYHHTDSLPKVVSVCDASYPPATPDLVCLFPTPDKAKTCPSSTTNKPWIGINLLDRVWKPNKVTMHASLLATAFLQPCLVLYEGKLTKFSDLLLQIYSPHTHATNTSPLTVLSIGPSLMCIRTYIIFWWRKMRDKISGCSGSGTPNSQQYKTSHKNERRQWGKKRRKRKRHRKKRRLRKEQGPQLENTRKALEIRSGKWRIESEQGGKQCYHTDSGIGPSITASVSRPEQSEPPQHYPNPMKDGPMACAIVMNPMQETETETETETPAQGQEKSLPIAKQEEHSTHSENYGPTEAGEEEDVKPLSEIKICPSLCEAEHASIRCNLTSQLPEKVHDSGKHSAVVLPPLRSGTGALGQSESFTVGGCEEVANYEDTSESDLISQNIINPSNCMKENSHPPEMQESGENEDEELAVPTCESLSPPNCMNSSLEFLSPTHQQRLLLPPCTSETSRHHHRCSVCVASATSSNDAMNYPKYKPIEREAASFSHMHLTGQQPSQEETGDNETVRVESDEGRSRPTAFFLPPRPLQSSHLRPLSPSSDPPPVSLQTRTRGEDLGCNIFSSPCGDQCTS